jgi:hypothetical protein
VQVRKTRPAANGYRLTLSGALALAVLGQPAPAGACSAPNTTPRQLLEQATAIIHVKVRGECTEGTGACGPPPPPSAPPPPRLAPYAPGWPSIAPPPAKRPSTGHFPGDHYGFISVDVVEVLKGSAIPQTFAVRGKLDQRDHFIDPPAPRSIRRDALAGACFAYGYREGAEYLLFLRKTNQGLSPYWAPLSPVNEQLRSKDDPWIQWVRRRLTGE